MPFEEGNQFGNRSGRPKGSPNKTTKEIRDSFQMFVEGNQDKFDEWISRVAEKNPAKAIELVTNLAEYILPKLSRTEVQAEIKTDEVDLSKLPQEVLDQLLADEDDENEATS
jgi:hypothetical protein